MSKLTPQQIHKLSQLIGEFIDGMKEDYTSVLSNLAEKAYKDGINSAKKLNGKITYSNADHIYNTLPNITDSLNSRIDSVIDAMKNDLLKTLKKCIYNKYNYTRTKQELNNRIKFLETHIPFDAVGKTYTKPSVVNGKLTEIKHTITKPKTMSVDSYFNTLSQSISKRAYLMAKTYEFVNAGYSNVEYRSKHDNKVRSSHRKMNGKIAKIGGNNFKLFIELMLEYGCRCDIIPRRSVKRK